MGGAFFGTPKCSKMIDMSQAVEALILLAHPNAGSFNHALAGHVREALEQSGAPVRFHDLYAEEFDPVMTADEFRRKFSFDPSVQAFTQEIHAARLLVFVHPDWWGQPPAILKGWVDRVFRPGVAYEYEGEEFIAKEKIPLLTNHRALVIITSEASAFEMETPIHLWRRKIFEFCGVMEDQILVMPNLRDSTHRQRRDFLERAGKEARRLYELPDRLP
jgi:NAD(P)H dehydrogenase (quinone)